MLDSPRWIVAGATVLVAAAAVWIVLRSPAMNGLPPRADASIAAIQQAHLPDLAPTDLEVRVELLGSTPHAEQTTLPEGTCAAYVVTVLDGTCDVDASLWIADRYVALDQYTNDTPIVYACTDESADATLELWTDAFASCEVGVRELRAIRRSEDPRADQLRLHAQRYLDRPLRLGDPTLGVSLAVGQEHALDVRLAPGCYGVVAAASPEADLDLYAFDGDGALGHDDAWDHLAIVEFCVERETRVDLILRMYAGASDVDVQVFETAGRADVRIPPEPSAL